MLLTSSFVVSARRMRRSTFETSKFSVVSRDSRRLGSFATRWPDTRLGEPFANGPFPKGETRLLPEFLRPVAGEPMEIVDAFDRTEFFFLTDRGCTTLGGF